MVVSWIRVDRDEMNRIEKDQEYLKGAGFALVCCDCGLTHDLRNWDEKDLHCIPHRPGGYKYRLR